MWCCQCTPCTLASWPGSPHTPCHHHAGWHCTRYSCCHSPQTRTCSHSCHRQHCRMYMWCCQCTPCTLASSPSSPHTPYHHHAAWHCMRYSCCHSPQALACSHSCHRQHCRMYMWCCQCMPRTQASWPSSPQSRCPRSLPTPLMKQSQQRTLDHCC